MKTLIAILVLLVCGDASAQTGPKPRKPIIYCMQAEPLEAEEHMTIRVDRQEGRAADWMHVEVVDDQNPSKKEVIVDQLIELEMGEPEQGEVTRVVQEKSRLIIDYPHGKSKLRYLPSVFVGYKDGKPYAVPVRCSHL